jgi:hypothetical protein
MSLIIKKNTTFKIPRTGSGAPSEIIVTSIGGVIMSGSGPTYSAFFGSGNGDGYYGKQTDTLFGYLGILSIYYEAGFGAWTGYWDNGDNSYNWVIAPQSSSLVIPINWGNGLTISAA